MWLAGRVARIIEEGVVCWRCDDAENETNELEPSHAMAIFR